MCVLMGITFASRTLTASEQNYSQLEKEALSLIFGVRKFHQHLYSRPFVLLTDHKPLTAIFGEKTGIPSLAAARLQRWALLLSSYQYRIEYRSTSVHANADGLPRLPIVDDAKKDDEWQGGADAAAFNLAQIDSLPVTVEKLKVTTARDLE